MRPQVDMLGVPVNFGSRQIIEEKLLSASAARQMNWDPYSFTVVGPRLIGTLSTFNEGPNPVYWPKLSRLLAQIMVRTSQLRGENRPGLARSVRPNGPSTPATLRAEGFRACFSPRSRRIRTTHPACRHVNLRLQRTGRVWKISEAQWARRRERGRELSGRGWAICCHLERFDLA